MSYLMHYVTILIERGLTIYQSRDWSKLKAFADDKLNVAQNLKLVSGRVENIVGKGENAGHQHFLLFLQCLQKILSLMVVKSRDCVVKG